MRRTFNLGRGLRRGRRRRADEARAIDALRGAGRSGRACSARSSSAERDGVRGRGCRARVRMPACTQLNARGARLRRAGRTSRPSSTPSTRGQLDARGRAWSSRNVPRPRRRSTRAEGRGGRGGRRRPQGATADRAAFDAARRRASCARAASSCVVLAGFMRLVTPVLAGRVPEPRRQHAPGALAGVPRGRTRRRRRSRTACGSPGAPCTSSTPGRTPGRSSRRRRSPVLRRRRRRDAPARILKEEHALLPRGAAMDRRGARDVSRRATAPARASASTASRRPRRAWARSHDARHARDPRRGEALRRRGARRGSARSRRRRSSRVARGACSCSARGIGPPTYAYDGVTLARRPFTFLAAILS